MGSFGTLEQLRSGMQELYSVQVGGGIGVYRFLVDSSGQVPFLALATKWLLGDSAREVPLCAEGDAVLYLNNVHPLLKILNINEIPEEELTALARVIVDELIMLFCERWVGDMTEEEQSVYINLPDDNTWAYMKRAMIMYKGILQPEGYLLTDKDILVLLEGITAEIQTMKSNTADQPKTAAPPVVQETKKDTTPITPAYQPKQDIINHIDNNKGSFRGWLAVAHLEIDGIVSPKGKCQIDRVKGCEIFYKAYETHFMKNDRTFEKVKESLKKQKSDKVKNRGSLRDV